MMDPELVNILTPLGIGGVLAAFMFYFYRKDMKENADRLKEVIDANNSREGAWKEVVVTNTKAMTECTKLTEMMFNYLMDAHDKVKRIDASGT